MLATNLVRVLIGCAADLAEARRWSEAEARLLEARRIDGGEPQIYAWEGVIAYQQGLFNAALDRLEEALRRDPKLALAHEYIGMVHYKREHLELALRSFKTAIELDPTRKARLESFMSKLEKELEREGAMRVLRSTHFLCKFGDEQERQVAEEVLDYLEDAYTRVGRSLREYPQETLTVVLYADRDFQAATGAQGWAAGIFDGKIRVPIRNFRGVRRQIRAVLCHEYSHFVARQICADLPAWLNEGLAQLMEGRDPRDVAALLAGLAEKDKLVPLAGMVTTFAGESDATKVRVLYAESLSFVGWLARRAGEERLGDLLRALGQRRELDAAFRATYGEGLADLEKAWIGDLGR